jgi:outer membrane protein assembly factor BamA
VNRASACALLAALCLSALLGVLPGARGVAGAQPPPVEPEPASPPDPGAAGEAPPPPIVPRPPDLWTEWEVQAAPGARLLEDRAAVRALFEPDMRTHQALTEQAQRDLEEAALRLGYQLVQLEIVRPPEGGVRAVLHLAPRLIIRRVAVNIDQWTRLAVKEQIERRLRLRPGDPLAEAGPRREAQLRDEEGRLTEFLKDDGFFEAKVEVRAEPSGPNGVVLYIDADLGPDYYVGQITVKPDGPLALSRTEIGNVFDHCRLRILGACRWRSRFTHGQHKADLQRLTEMYQRRGYPAARVRSDYDNSTSFNRATRTVDFELRIDERRRLAIEFEGNDKVLFADDLLARQLTFDEAGSADDLEVAASALAIQRFYQQRGWFDAAVSWERERKRVEDRGGDRSFDLIRFRIDAGAVRRVRGVEIVGARAIPEDELRALIETRAAPTSFRLIGGTTTVTSELLQGDVARITQRYQARGFLEARVRVHAAPQRAALGDAALAAALLAAGRGAGDLYVRFTIEEGPRTEIAWVDVAFDGPHQATRQEVLDQLDLRPGTPYHVTDLQNRGRALGEWYWRGGGEGGRGGGGVRKGRGCWVGGSHLPPPPPPARVQLDVREEAPGRMAVVYRIDELQELRIGKVVVRGNFRTKQWVIQDELGFREGELLTAQLYQRGKRRLHATGLFAAVDLDLVNFDQGAEETTHVVVRVVERHDVKLYIDGEVGYSDQKKAYLRAAPVFPNPLRNGIALELGLTAGLDLLSGERAFESEELAIRVPRWVTRDRLKIVDPDVQLSALRRIQQTERFGELTTYSGTVAATRTWSRSASKARDARATSATLRYDFRLRNRNEDSVRLAGNNATVERTQVQSRTGIVGVGVTLDQRVEASGHLNPLAPYRGWKLDGGVGLASRYLLGQDDFVKLNAAGQWIRQLSRRVQLRLEGRYDQGIPLGNAVLLPEVERFFGGGDDTVRGFPQDRLAIEIIEQPVPPFEGVTQVRVLPAGGNIRILGTVDLQLTLWRIKSLPVASALFVDTGIITNSYAALGPEDVRPAVGVALARLLTPLGGLSLEWALPLLPRPHDPPLGRLHFVVALRY